MLALAACGYDLVVAPARGGAILRLDRNGRPILRPAEGPSILDVACFPLVPFSNRIAFGRFAADGRAVTLPTNMPGSAHPHPLHGFGWLSAWRVMEATIDHARIVHDHPAGAWPWFYRAEQTFALDRDGVLLTLSILNTGADAMPAGLGFHPYFPRDAATVYRGLHRGRWRTAPDGLPERLDERPEPRDWWDGAPVGAQAVDTVFTGRAGALTIRDGGREVTLTPSPELPLTVVYTPARQPWFCVEPVSHATDAVNRPDEADGMRWLMPGERMAVSLRIAVRDAAA